jgi:thioredoxin 2
MPQLVCPGCEAVNRLPADSDAAAAKCGRCGEKLFRGAPLEVTSAQLETHRRSTKGTAILLDVWAPWCGPCRSMAPQFAAAAGRLEPGIRLLKLNSDANPDAAAALGITGIPALFLISEGQLIARKAGLMNAGQIVAWARQALASAAAA